MSVQIINCEQGSDEWLRLRCKRLTSSRFHEVDAAVQFATPFGRTPAQLKAAREALDLIDIGAINKLAAVDDIRDLTDCKKPAIRDALEVPGFDKFNAMFCKMQPPVVADCYYLDELVTERIYGEPFPVDVFAMRWGKDHEEQARRVAAFELDLDVIEVGLVFNTDFPFVSASPDGLIKPKSGLEIKCPSNPINHMRTWLSGMPEKHIGQIQGNIWINEADDWHFCSFDPRPPVEYRLYHEVIKRDQSYIDHLEKCVVAFEAAVQAKVDLVNERTRVYYGEAA